MMKYFVVADVHGFYTEMMQALNKAGFDPKNPDHCFVSLGDLLDRGLQPRQCLEFVMSLDPSRRIFIRGNHEDLMEQAIARMKFIGYDFTNGTTATARMLTGARNDVDTLIGIRNYAPYNNYIRECIDYFETDHYVFTHGWIPCQVLHHLNLHNRPRVEYCPIENWRTTSKEDWEEARWTNGMEAWSNGIQVPDKTVMCGHWHASWGHSHLHEDGTEWDTENTKAKFTPFEDKGIIALDACTAYSRFVNCVVVED